MVELVDGHTQFHCLSGDRGGGALLLVPSHHLKILSTCAFFSDACKIKETTNGGRRRSGRQTRQEKFQLAEGRIQEHVPFNVGTGAAKSGQDKTKETPGPIARQQTAGLVKCGISPFENVQTSIPVSEAGLPWIRS